MNESTTKELELQVELTERFVALSERLDKTNAGKLIKAATPIVSATARLVEIGLKKLERDQQTVDPLLTPKQLADAINCSVRHLSRHKQKWDWFRPEFGDSKGQRYRASIVDRYVEARKEEGGDNG